MARVKMWRKVMGVDQEVANQSPTLIHGVTDGPGFYKGGCLVSLEQDGRISSCL